MDEHELRPGLRRAALHLGARAGRREELLLALESALAPFAARPHWGKLFCAEAAAIAPLYERHPDFVSLAERWDPRGAFRTPWLEARVLGVR
ncbi:D-arabinono-1,4-lactone oxidase [Blastococcus brunescens]|uniref:D-arabinono-1,4-lactone oxidase n=1 Tax=Blastococcus brunescens TaxID=1564165 RepID=A0ABZ1BAQ9_9ACTN|nr:D-arabinono-1,4-lactone oxidase [Blastococcus sp. BMG 8361]WRL66664.1 D-arabinono-1,4-lactone oxidase [Blastococcus sp. BMG 8361]